jgi:hypothetical protein
MSKMKAERKTGATELVWTMDVPKAGRKYYDAGRDKSYAMAKSGEMPAVKFGRVWRALPFAIERKLKGD